LQQIFFCVSQIRFNASSLSGGSEFKTFLSTGSVSTLNSTTLPFEDHIALENVSYKHPQAEIPTFQNLVLRFRKNSIIGITGPSGSGKSTLVNLLLGVLKPDKGGICIDGKLIKTPEITKLNTIMSYVPQDIFIVDDTIAKNIALYSSEAEIDYNLLEKVIKITELEFLIKHEMPNGFETVLGERGNRISGGQKQRIGLARALYRQPKILVLDEATSALDLETEKRVMSHISQLREEMTIIMIAHRLSILDICDEVYDLLKLNNP
jgi:ATP-binding cassette, subfamily B, bacterial PglK